MFCVNIDSNLALRSAIYAYNVSGKNTFAIGDSTYRRLPSNKQQFFDCNCSGAQCLVAQIPKLETQCLKDKKFGIHGSVKVGGDIYVNNSGVILFGDGIFDFKLGNGDGHDDGLVSVLINSIQLRLIKFFPLRMLVTEARWLEFYLLFSRKSKVFRSMLSPLRLSRRKFIYKKNSFNTNIISREARNFLVNSKLIL